MKTTNEIAKALYEGYCIEACDLAGPALFANWKDLDPAYQLCFKEAVKGTPEPKAMYALYYMQFLGAAFNSEQNTVLRYEDLGEQVTACWAAGVAAAIAKQKEIA